MTRRQKILVIAGLVLLVLLFGGSVGVGASQDDGDASEPGGFVEWLGGLFGGPAAVAPADLRSDCLADGVLTVESRCVVTIAAADENVRELKLLPEQVLSVRARAPRSEDVGETTAEANEEFSVTVDERGGDVELICNDASGTCRVTLP